MSQTQMIGRNNSQSLKVNPWCEDVESKKNIRRKEINKIKSLNMEFVVFLRDFSCHHFVGSLLPRIGKMTNVRCSILAMGKVWHFDQWPSHPSGEDRVHCQAWWAQGRKWHVVFFFWWTKVWKAVWLEEDLRMIPKSHFVCLSLDFSLWNSVGA